MVRVKSVCIVLASLALSASASSVWDLVTTPTRPRRSVHRTLSPIPQPVTPVAVTNVVEKPVTNVVEKIVEVEKPVEKVVEKLVTVEVEKPVTNTVEVVKVETVEVEKPVTNVVEKIVEVEKPVEKVVEKLVTVEVEKPVTNTVEVVKVETVEVEKPVTNVVEKLITNVVEKVVTVEVEKPVTSIVEKVVYDRSAEMRLAKDKVELERRGGALEARNAGLQQRNDELKRALDAERDRRKRLEEAQAKATPGKKAVKTGRPARITSTTTYYDRKKGIAYFEGRVYVDDEQYQLHADKAYVFTSGTNDVRRIVAMGHVAMTNEMRRAYGAKFSYYRKDGMVVLYGDATRNAEVRDESKAEDQSVIGSKIKFWIDNEQVEVLDATIIAPREGAGQIIPSR